MKTGVATNGAAFLIAPPKLLVVLSSQYFWPLFKLKPD